MSDYGSNGYCPRCDQPIHDYREDAAKRNGAWVHLWCLPGADDDGPARRVSRSGRDYDTDRDAWAPRRRRRRR